MDSRHFVKIIIELQKILDYLLSPTHQIGQYKAEFFFSLGYHQLIWRSLERDIRDLLQESLVYAGNTVHGVKYTHSGSITGPNGKSAMLLTVWIANKSATELRFVTAYPER